MLTVITIAQSQIEQLFPSASHAQPFSPQSLPQLFLIFHPLLWWQPTNSTAWSSSVLQSVNTPDSQNCSLQDAIATETGFFCRATRTAEQSLKARDSYEVIWKYPLVDLQVPVLPVPPDVQGQAKSVAMPLPIIYIKGPSKYPPLHPSVRLVPVEQSITCWTDSSIGIPKAQMAKTVSRFWTAAKAQQAPHLPWYLASPANSLQSLSKLLKFVAVVFDKVWAIRVEEVVFVWVRMDDKTGMFFIQKGTILDYVVELSRFGGSQAGLVASSFLRIVSYSSGGKFSSDLTNVASCVRKLSSRSWLWWQQLEVFFLTSSVPLAIFYSSTYNFQSSLSVFSQQS